MRPHLKQILFPVSACGKAQVCGSAIGFPKRQLPVRRVCSELFANISGLTVGPNEGLGPQFPSGPRGAFGQGMYNP